MRGIFLINHSPKLRTDDPNHEDMNTPAMKMNVIEVTNPRPVKTLYHENIICTTTTIVGKNHTIQSNEQR